MNNFKKRAESHELRDKEIIEELKAEDFGCVDLGDVERASRLANIIGVVLAFGTVAVFITGFYWILRVLLFVI